MNNSFLKLATMYYVIEQDTLSPEQKKEFLEKIKITNINNLLYLLHICENRGGKILNQDQLILEFIDTVIKKKIKSIVPLQEIDLARLQSIIAKGGTIAAIASMLGVRSLSPLLTASLISSLAFQIYQQYLSGAARHCSEFQGLDRDICESQYKIGGLHREIRTLNAKSALCDNRLVRSKEVCKQKIAEKIEQAKGRLDKENYRLSQMNRAKEMTAQQGTQYNI